MTETLTPEAKIQSVADQLVLIQRGKINVMSCPYCAEMTEEGGTFCCGLMMAAIEAILHRQETEAQISFAAEVADRAAEEKPLVTIN